MFSFARNELIRCYLGHVTVFGNDHSRLPLNGFHHKGHDVGVACEALLERLDVIVRYLEEQKKNEQVFDAKRRDAG